MHSVQDLYGSRFTILLVFGYKKIPVMCGGVGLVVVGRRACRGRSFQGFDGHRDSSLVALLAVPHVGASQAAVVVVIDKFVID